MTDITWHLRVACGHDSRSVDGCVTCEAADEIERLRAEIAALSGRFTKAELQVMNAEAALASKSAPEIDASAGCVEPYGVVTKSKNTGQHFFYRWPDPPYLDNASECVTVYAAPQQRQPLPAHEIVTMYAECPRSDSEMIDFARAVEQAHGIG